MNAPTALSHLVPEIHQREVPAALIDALKARFGANCSTAMAVRKQHGRDESRSRRRRLPPWSSPKARRTWPMR